jgi:DNA helicase II / ATP-dependent DNA helicase PcrA
LIVYADSRKWDLDAQYSPKEQQRGLSGDSGITSEAQRRINSKRFNDVIRRRLEQGNPLKLKYVLKRATSIEWSLLDLFYQLTMFEHFAKMFDAAQRAEDSDEGPVCNLALLTQYISRFLDQRAPLIAGDLLHEETLQRMLFGSYLYALHRRGESEYEDAEDPFPKGRIPFLTVHQSKGLEFPVVVLGNPRKQKKIQCIEKIMVGILSASADREPLDRMPGFDTMRMFYVALSRAKNLLVIANYQSQGNYINPEFKSLVTRLPTIPQLKPKEVPAVAEERNDTPKIYSYTGDFLAYERCPRQYLMFRKFDFVPSRSQTMIFGSLVHRTLDDIHQHLISARANA